MLIDGAPVVSANLLTGGFCRASILPDLKHSFYGR